MPPKEVWFVADDEDGHLVAFAPTREQAESRRLEIIGLNRNGPEPLCKHWGKVVGPYVIGGMTDAVRDHILTALAVYTPAIPGMLEALERLLPGLGWQAAWDAICPDGSGVDKANAWSDRLLTSRDR